MAKATFINATLSGKLAGTVYARNRAGYYVRQLIKPLNPRSIKQVLARISFGTASQVYHTLGDDYKSYWYNFALTVFQPKHAVPGINYSGANAFTSLWNTALHAANNNLASATYTKETTPDVYTTLPIAPSKQPPNDPLSKTIIDHEHHTVVPILGTSNVTLINDNDVLTASFQINFGTPVVTLQDLADANGNKFGFGLYISDSVKQAYNFPPPTSKMLGFFPYATFTAPIANTSKLIAESVLTVTPSSFKSFPAIGDTVWVDIYQISLSGQANFLGKSAVTVTAAA